MKNRYATCLAVSAAMACAAAPTPSQALTGNDLYKWCSETGDLGKAMCVTYIAGVRDGVLADHIVSKRNPPFCLREGVTIEQLVAVTKKFMDDDPSIRDQDAAGVIEFALVGAFPCRKY